MDLQPEPLQTLGPHLTDSHDYGYAPMPLYGAMLYLNAGHDVVASVCRHRSSDGVVSWRVAWLTDQLIGFASVSKAGSDWDAESLDQEPDDSVAWVRPITEVVQVGTRLLNHRQVSAIGRRWESTPFPVIRWADGFEFSLPLFDELSERRGREATDAFAVELRKRLWA